MAKARQDTLLVAVAEYELELRRRVIESDLKCCQPKKKCQLDRVAPKVLEMRFSCSDDNQTSSAVGRRGPEKGRQTHYRVARYS
jgi:hypothetical protein